MADTIEILEGQLASLEEERNSWDAHWLELSEFLAPDRGRFTKKGSKPNQGNKRMEKIISNVAGRSISMLSAGMQGGLTSPSRPWFRLSLSSEEAMQQGDLRGWLSACEKIVIRALSRSNFYESAHQLYTEEAVFGTGCMLVLDTPPYGVRFHLNTIGEYSIGTGFDGMPIFFGRRFWATAAQLADHFGVAALSKESQDAIKEGKPFVWSQVTHVIKTNGTREYGKADNQNMPWASYYWQDGEKRFLSKGGYEEQPFVLVRWDTVGTDSYGRGPGMSVLPEVKQLQEMEKNVLMAVHKMVNPPMRVPPALAGRLNLLPGGQNVLDASGDDAVKPIYQIEPRLQDFEMKIEQVRSAIRGGFFNDLFLMLNDHPDMTATEVLERHQEKMLLLGPVIERMQKEFLDPTIFRVFQILWRQGMLPEAPPEMAKHQITVEYTSILAQAQREIGTASMTKLLNATAQAMQINPAAADKVNIDAVMDEFANALGTPPKLINPDNEVAQVRKARADAQMQQIQHEQQVQASQAAADGLAKVAGIDTGEGTLGGELASQMSSPEMGAMQ